MFHVEIVVKASNLQIDTKFPRIGPKTGVKIEAKVRGPKNGELLRRRSVILTQTRSLIEVNFGANF